MSAKRPLIHTAGLVLGLLAFGGASPEPTVPELEVVAPKLLDEFVVVATPKCLHVKRARDAPPPVLLDSFPKPGGAVRPGVIVLRLTFDRPMTCDGFLHAAGPAPNPCPARTQRMSQSFDRRTFWVLCEGAPQTDYAVRLGPRFRFRSLDGQVFEPGTLAFRTSTEAPAKTIPEALAQDDFELTQRYLRKR